MYTELNSRPLELDIREHFTLFSDDHVVCEQLLKKYESVNLMSSELDSLGSFSLKLGNAPAYIQFCMHRLKLSLDISWAHFASALYQVVPDIPEVIKKAFVDGATATDHLNDLARCHDLDSFIPENSERRAERRVQIKNEFEAKRTELLSDVETWRVQELEDDEERVLNLLLRMCPMDEQIIAQAAELRERKAIRILENKLQSRQSVWDQFEHITLSDEERKELDQILNQWHLLWAASGFDEDVGHDLAISMIMWDYPEAALDFLPEQSPSPRTRWTRLEALLLARHFVALLNEIERAELLFTPHDPDATFQLLYLKALGLWGLGHRFAAVEIMEGIVNHQPHFRSAMTLLHLWKGGDT